MNDGGIEVIAESMKLNRCIVELVLHNTHLKAGDSVFLCEALKTNSSLKLLDLRFNKRSGNWGHACSSNVELKSLLGIIRGVNAEIGQFLGIALQQNKSLAEIKVGINRTDAKCKHLIADGLKVNNTLQRLDISRSHINMEAIAEDLQAWRVP